MAKRRGKKRRRGGDSLLRQAQTEASVRYGPEVRALSELLAEARTDLEQGIKAEEGAAAGIKAAAKAALPEMRRNYERAGQSGQEADADVARALGGLGGAADPFRAVTAREQGAARRRLSEAMADSQRELQARGVDAEAGRAFAVRNQKAQYAQDVKKIRRQRSALAGEIGQFTQATYRDLKDAQAKLDLENQKLSLDIDAAARQERKTEADITGIDPATGKPTAAERARQREAAKGKKPKFSREALSAHQKLVGNIEDAQATVQRLRKTGMSFSNIGTVMTSAKGEKNPYGGFGPITARAAVELVRDKRITSGTMRRLTSRGLLRHRAPKSWRRPARKPARSGEEIVNRLAPGLLR